MKHHESISDVNVRRIFRVAIIFIVVGAAINLGIWWMFSYYRNVDAQRDVSQTLIEPPSPIPPEPRLEVNPAEDFQTYKRLQQQILTNYGWASREEGRVHIPIERAMEKFVEIEAKNASK